MKITAVQAYEVRVPWRKAFTTAAATLAASDCGIVCVETDEGIEGIGEISMFWNGGGAFLCSTVRCLLAPAVVGLSPFDVVQALKHMDNAVQFSRAANPAKAAVEMALYDIVGKYFKTPVYNLLGGRVRDRILLSMSVALGEPDQMARDAAIYVEQGFKCVKVKVGLDPDADVRRVAAVRRAVGPTIMVRVDANMGWRSSPEAIAAIRRMEEYNIHSVEQPLSAGSLGGLREVRAAVGVPIMADESVWGPDDAAEVIACRAADILNVYVSEAGGLYHSVNIFSMVRASGLTACIGSMPELGVGTAAAIHLATCVEDLPHPSDVCGILYHAGDVIHESFRIEGGYVVPLDGPGLGVTLERTALNRYKI
jgi:muconate cycloisomerase